jgi:uncharacterized cupin superfamily protein
MTDQLDVFHDPVTYDDTDPPGYRGGEVMRVREAGGGELQVRAYELAAGESLCPYHYEYVEEWLLLLTGELDVRTPAGTERLEAGALVRFPSGPDGAHKVTTPAGEGAPARFVMFSSAQEPSLAVYPDSDKIGVWAPGGADNVILRRADGHVDYYDGEN